MLELYESFEEAQKISHVGSWTYNVKIDKNIWSNEMYRLCNRELHLGPPSFEEYLTYVHPEDRYLFEKTFKKFKVYGHESDFEFRFLVNGQERWVSVRSRIIKRDEYGNIEIISGTLSDITERKIVEKKISSLNEQLIIAARRAGMAEVASSVLHNIGNVLNSLNVNASILLEKISNNKVKKIKNISELINAHKENLSSFIENDAKGKYIPEYLSSLAEYWDSEQKNYIQNLTTMNEHIQHVKEIIGRQQSLSVSIGLIQPVLLNELIEDAISIVIPNQQKSDIEIKKEFAILEETLVDKAVLLQILVNLIRNAKESLDESNKKNKKLLIKLTLKDSETASINVEDNGMGIAPDCLKKIFTFGFTTKGKGFGIGLHTSLLASRSMNGKLEVFNVGKDKGAIFELTFPYKAIQNSN